MIPDRENRNIWMNMERKINRADEKMPQFSNHNDRRCFVAFTMHGAIGNMNV